MSKPSQIMRKQKESKPQQHLSLSISQKSYNLFSMGQNGNRERIEIFEPCRIFQNVKTSCNKYVTLDQAKKGKIPILNHALIASLDAIKSTEKGIKWRLNKPCPFVPGLPTYEIFLDLKNYNRNYSPKGYKLSKGDLIKIGNKRLRVLSIDSPQEDQERGEDQNYFQFCKSFFIQSMEVEGACRICLHEEVDRDDFMMTPCQCRGSCATVHYNCLKHWVSSKIQPINDYRNERLTSYSLKNLKCEICKSSFPTAILTPNSISSPFYLFNLKTRPQSLNLTLEIEGEPMFYQVSLKNKEIIQIGRSLTSDIILWQHYISKLHAEISLEDGQFYLKDLVSQYGTLIQLKNSIEIRDFLQLEIAGKRYRLEENLDHAIQESRCGILQQC